MSTYSESDHARSADGRWAATTTSEADIAVLEESGTDFEAQLHEQYSLGDEAATPIPDYMMRDLEDMEDFRARQLYCADKLTAAPGDDHISALQCEDMADAGYTVHDLGAVHRVQVVRDTHYLDGEPIVDVERLRAIDSGGAASGRFGLARSTDNALHAMSADTLRAESKTFHTPADVIRPVDPAQAAAFDRGTAGGLSIAEMDSGADIDTMVGIRAQAPEAEPWQVVRAQRKGHTGDTVRQYGINMASAYTPEDLERRTAKA